MGRLYIHAGAGSIAALTDRLLWCATDDDQRQHHHEHHFLFLSANSFVFCIERSNITLTHSHVSNCRVRQLQFSGIFVALGFVGNGVITVMINSPWQADDDADNQSGDNRGGWLCSYINLWPFRPLLNFAIRLSALCSNLDHNQSACVARY